MMPMETWWTANQSGEQSKGGKKVNRKLGESGKITASIIIVIVLIGVIGYFIYDWYYSQEERMKREGGAMIAWSIILENGDVVQLKAGESLTFYRGIMDPLALYSDSARTHKINGFRSDLYVKPKSEETGNVTITSTIDSGTYGNYLEIISSGGTVVWKSNWIGKPNRSIPPNVETKLSDWYGVVGAVNFTGQATGTYTIKSIYTFKSTQGSLTSTDCVDSSVTAYWTKNTLTIVARIGWAPLNMMD